LRDGRSGFPLAIQSLPSSASGCQTLGVDWAFLRTSPCGTSLASILQPETRHALEGPRWPPRLEPVVRAIARRVFTVLVRRRNTRQSRSHVSIGSVATRDSHPTEDVTPGSVRPTVLGSAASSACCDLGLDDPSTHSDLGARIMQEADTDRIRRKYPLYGGMPPLDC